MRYLEADKNVLLTVKEEIRCVEYPEKQGVVLIRMTMKLGHSLPFDLHLLIIDRNCFDIGVSGVC